MIVGGYVYRGPAVPVARGLYFFGDCCSGELWVMQRTKKGVKATPLERRLPLLSSFGQDANGELFAVTTGGALYELR